MAGYSTAEYAKMAKGGFLLGVGLFLLGALGGLLAPMVTDPVPAWEQTLFLYAEVAGTVVGFFSPLLFGVVLPLTR